MKKLLLIPKGTNSLDMEIWNNGAPGQIELFNGLPSTGMKHSRTVALTDKAATLRIPLQPGEDGFL